jgi:hypothetical protein
MKKILNLSLVGLSLILSTLILTLWWISNPEFFPTIPESWVLAFVNFFYDTSKEIVDVEFLVAFTLSAIVISICSLTLYISLRILKNR